ncbi:MAG TPA: hypothetical protein VMT53_10545 [Terriglobales bacterium]|nr:hypothetical protein [Terriglobales bacterium]
MLKQILAAFLLSLSLASAFAGTAKVERVDKPSDSPVPTTVWDVLDAKGYRLTLDDGAAVADVWLRKNIPPSGAKETEGVLFPEIPPSTLLGVISFPKPAADFRGQQIKPGFYDLRYELIPNDGNHLGVSPNRDFVLLVPPVSDSDPAAQFKFNEVVALSRKATGTNHPGPLSLVQADSAIPGLSHNDQDQWVFSFKIPVGTEQIPIGLIVKGVAQQ